MPEDFLHISNLKCGYGNIFNISDINLKIKQGTIAGIIGPNGAGKTTLFKGISGELKVKSGSVILSGNNIAHMSYKERSRSIAVVSQYTDRIDIPVEDYVLMGRTPYHRNFQFFETKTDFETAEKYMAVTDVLHLRKKLMSELSGGEQQLASVARALTQQPQLLLLDEPTSHLDIAHQVKVLNLIQKLNDELGITVIMIMHDLNLAGEYCNYLIMLTDGKIFTNGTPEEVLNYDNIEKVYKTVVITQKNPYSGRPAIFLVSEKIMNSISNNKK